MRIFIVEFIDLDIGIEEYEGEWKIKEGCLMCDMIEKGSTTGTVIPLRNIFRLTDYGEK